MNDLKPAVVITFDDEDEVDRVLFFRDHNDAVSVLFDSGLEGLMTVVEVYEPGQLPADLPLKQRALPSEGDNQ